MSRMNRSCINSTGLRPGEYVTVAVFPQFCVALWQSRGRIVFPPTRPPRHGSSSATLFASPKNTRV